MLKKTAGQHVAFLSLLTLSFIVLRSPLAILLKASLHDDRYSHVFFIPFISACLIYFRKTSIFQESGIRFLAAPLLLSGTALYWMIQRRLVFSDANDYLSCSMFAFVLTWIPAFFLCYGLKPFRAALFPLCFLLLMIPMPTLLLERAVGFLQSGSADTTEVLFRIFGVPALRSGFVFSLGGNNFEIATECSGIHSCLVLFIASILVSHLFLRSGWARVCFPLFAILAAIFKNGVRIVTISTLTTYVDAAYYNSWLHRNGGLPFSLVALAILAPVLFALQKAETHASKIPNERPRAEVTGAPAT